MNDNDGVEVAVNEKLVYVSPALVMLGASGTASNGKSGGGETVVLGTTSS